MRCIGTVYHVDTGAVEMAIDAPDKEGVEAQRRPGVDILMDQALDGATRYVKNGAAAIRPVMPITQLKNGRTITFKNIPKGTLVNFPGTKLRVDDGFVQWSTAEGGEYTFRFTNFPYQEVEIDASFD
jgi:hypothetical protein